jgi:glycosyltransferase involved in cell wall biosynthesis
MKVAFLTMGKDIGGAKNDVITLSRQIADMGHTVYVLSAPGVMDKELADTNVRFIPVEFYTRNPLGLFKASRQLLRIIRREGIELVNPQGFFTAAISWLTRFSLRPSFIPIVTTIHMFSSLKFYKYAWMLNIFSKEVITESNCERVRLEGGGTKRDIITVINNSVDMSLFSQKSNVPVLRNEYGIGEDILVFGLIARLSPEKRHDVYIEAAKIVHGKNPNTRFFIVGDGPTMETTRKRAEGLDYILFTGMRRDIPNCLRSLDCFVLCSEVESLPLSIREAMSMELPVVVTDVGGNREIVAEGITGYLVPSKNSAALADAMLKIANDPKKAKAMGKEAWQYCKDRFDAINWAKYTEQKFKTILNIK